MTTTETIQYPPLDDFNKWALFWYHDVGMNVIPTDAKKKLPIVKWSPYQNESISEELFIQCINQGIFRNGIGVITGKIWRGRHAGKYLTAVDLDNKLAIDEFSNYGGTKVCWQNITFVETRGDGKGKLHLYFISNGQIPDKQVDNAPEMIDKKDANLAPSIEVKGSCKKLIYPTPNRGYHPLSPIEIIDFSKSYSDLINHISEICQKYGLRYIKDILAYDQYAQYDILNDISLTDSDIQKIANLWAPYYKSGNRHDISVGTIGLYAKNGLTIDTAKKLSLELSRITKDDQTRLIDLTSTYSRLSQKKSIRSVAVLELIIGDNLGPILSEFHNILRCYKRVEQDFDEKLIHNGSNIRSQLNDRRSHDTLFIPNPDPTFNRAVAKPIKIQSTDSNSFIQLIIGFIHEQRDEIRLEPKILLKELKSFVISKSLDYHKALPQDPSWLVRRLRSYRDILKEAGLILDMHRSNGRRYIVLKNL